MSALAPVLADHTAAAIRFVHHEARLLDERRFTGGVVYLRYRVGGADTVDVAG